MNPHHEGSSRYGLDEVNISFLDKNKTAPLIISPRWNDTLEFICVWLETNRSWVENQILRYGAVLVRGFQVDSASDFERATLSLQPALSDTYRGTSPRSLKDPTKYAFSAADAPVNYPIAQHLEMSFLKAPPRQLYFGCLKASRCTGGETALCDFRKVFQDLPSELRKKLASQKIKYTRKHQKVGEKYTFDVGAMLGWPKLFGTSDPREVDSICLAEDAPKPRWVGPNKDVFLQEWVDEPFQKHPETGEDVWFNHSQVFHWTTFPAEMWYSFCRIRDWRLLIHFIVVTVFTVIKYGILRCKMALNTTFGDGSPITFKEMNQIRAAIHKNMVFSRWEKGDIMCIDNFSTSHGRQPTTDKGRTVIVAWSQPHDKRQPIERGPESIRKAFAVEFQPVSKGVEAPPDLVESPDVSPFSTLTNEEAINLQESMAANKMILGHKLAAVAASSKNIRFNSEKGISHHTRIPSCPELLHRDSDFWKAVQ
eukprot:scaffold831_cov109-Cylindrotheca_fusiformis.AAC.4